MVGAECQISNMNMWRLSLYGKGAECVKLLHMANGTVRQRFCPVAETLLQGMMTFFKGWRVLVVAQQGNMRGIIPKGH